MGGKGKDYSPSSSSLSVGRKGGGKESSPPPPPPSSLPLLPLLEGVELEPLLATHLQAVKEVVDEAFRGGGGGSKGSSSSSIRWDTISSSSSSSSSSLEHWVTRLSERVFTLQEKTEDLLAFIHSAERQLTHLSTCVYDHTVMKSHMDALQIVVDGMNLGGYSHIDLFVAHLEERLENVFRRRLTQALEAWIASFQPPPVGGEGRGGEHSSSSSSSSRLRRKKKKKKTGGGAASTHPPTHLPSITLEPSVHEILLVNQTLFLSPPLEEAGATYISQLHTYLGTSSSSSSSSFHLSRRRRINRPPTHPPTHPPRRGLQPPPAPQRPLRHPLLLLLLLQDEASRINHPPRRKRRRRRRRKRRRDLRLPSPPRP